MEQEVFVRRYLSLLGAKAASYGIDPRAMTAALWRGTAAMSKNDGAVNNRKRFWDSFAADLGQEIRGLEPVFTGFYGCEFDAARDAVMPNPQARLVVDTLRVKGYTLALATNPLFPPVAIDTRLNWIGLNRADFAYISDYENSRYCKPDPGYFKDVLFALGKCSKDALMVGNSISEDMAAKDAGLAVYLITDFVEGEGDISLFPHGSFAEFTAYAQQLPKANT
jgi:FMN phosphatase YigB (HAD superfamily)